MIGGAVALARRLDELYRRRDAAGLARVLFNRRLTAGQAEIAALAAFQEHARAAVCCYTQYGKTFSMGTGMAIDLIMDPRPRKVAVVAPREEQARLIRAEFLGAALSSELGVRELGLTRKGADRMQREQRVNRFVTRHGKDYKILTTGKEAAGGAGEALMGHGVSGTPNIMDAEEGAAGLVIVTEAGLIPESAWPKITRMLGGDTSVLLVEGNPWRKGTGFHRFWTRQDVHKIHIDWRQGVQEGRLRPERVEEEQQDAPPLVFTVLYESQFPDTAEDQLINWEWINAAIVGRPATPNAAFGIGGDTVWVAGYGLDVAEGGADASVLTRIATHPQTDQVAVLWQKRWKVADTMETAQRAFSLMDEPGPIGVDSTGVGKGAGDRLRELGASVYEMKSARSGDDKERFANLGSEVHWKLRGLFEGRRIRLIQPHPQLLADLPRYTVTQRNGRVAVEVDGGKAAGRSPDHGDSLAYAIWAGRGSPPLKYRIPRGQRRGVLL